MKNNNKLKLIFFCILLASVISCCGFSTFRGETGKGNANIVTVKTPADKSRTRLKWSRCFKKTGTTSANSIPVLTKDSIYLVNTNILYELDYNGNIKRQTTLCAKMNSISNMLLEGNRLFIPLSGGIMECINIQSMSAVWQSKAFGGQSLSTVFYHEGYLYAGSTTVTNSGTSGIFYCLNSSDGSTVWTYEDTEHKGGYYWSGGIVHKNTLYFAGDNGYLVSHSLLTSEVYDTCLLTDTAKIRAGITFDEETDALYTVSNDGTLYQITTEGRQIQQVKKTPIAENGRSMNCTSTPTICQGRIYVGGIADNTGIVSIMDAGQMKVIHTIRGAEHAEIKSSPLLSTGENTDGTVSVYVTANSLPGGIYYFTDSKRTTAGTLQPLFEPDSAKQFCMSSVTAGSDGTLYYSNDSGTLFAIHETTQMTNAANNDGQKTTPVPPSGKKQERKTNRSLKRPKKPSKITIHKRKRLVTVKWKKFSAKYQTIVYRKYGSGKWKKKLLKKKKTITWKRKKGKTLHFRLRTRLKVNGRWRYSGYTKIFHLK